MLANPTTTVKVGHFFCVTLYKDIDNNSYACGVLVSLNGPVSSTKESMEIHFTPTREKAAVFLNNLDDQADPGLILQVPSC